MVQKLIELTYDTDAKRIQAELQIGTAETNVSQVYVTAHLPESANQAKSAWSAKGPGDVTLEAIYEKTVDGDPNSGPRLVINVTAGSSAVPVNVSVVGADGIEHSAIGETGTPLTITL